MIYVYVSVMLIYRVRYRYIIYRSVRYDAYLTIYRVRKGIYKEILERVSMGGIGSIGILDDTGGSERVCSCVAVVLLCMVWQQYTGRWETVRMERTAAGMGKCGANGSRSGEVYE